MEDINSKIDSPFDNERTGQDKKPKENPFFGTERTGVVSATGVLKDEVYRKFIELIAKRDGATVIDLDP